MFEKVIALADSFLDMGIPGYDLVIYKDGKQLLRHWNGYADLETKTPINGDEVYDIYSCSKLMTCIAALQLWEKGLFALEDRLADYMPEFSQMTVQTENGIVPAKNPILIKHLFEMTAGFSYDMKSPAVVACQAATDGKCPTREFMRYLAKEPLLFEPGDQYKYSLCHDVLLALVEVLSGQDFESYAKENIYTPAGMVNTTFLPRYDQIKNFAKKYFYNSQTGIMKPITTNSYRVGSEYISGGAGAVSTVEDFIRLLEAVRTGKLLKPETVRLMGTDRLTDYQKRTFPVAETRGYGLGVRTPKEGHPHKEFGWGGAAGAYWAIDLTHNVTVFYAQHVLASPNNDLRKDIYSLVFDQLTGMQTCDFTRSETQKNLTY